MSHHQNYSASILTSLVTGFIAIVPPGVLGYAEKLVSVFVLAMAAEAGRRLVARFGKASK